MMFYVPVAPFPMFLLVLCFSTVGRDLGLYRARARWPLPAGRCARWPLEGTPAGNLQLRAIPGTYLLTYLLTDLAADTRWKLGT